MASALERWDDNLWTATGEHRFLGLQFRVRSTVVRLASGELWIHSPIRLTAELQGELAELGDVAHLVAPNPFHHLFVTDYLEAYPDSRLHAAPGLREKRGDLAIHSELTSSPHVAWQRELGQHVFAGARSFREVVFLHHKSRTLIVCDLVSNFHQVSSLPSRLYFRAMGVYGQPGTSRLVRLVFRDRRAAQSSRDHVLSWDFDRVLLAHGEPIVEDGKNVFARALSWLS